MKHAAEIVLACIWILIAFILIGILSWGIGGRLSFRNWTWNGIDKIFDRIDDISGASIHIGDAESGNVLESEESLVTEFATSRVTSIKTDLISENVELVVWSGDDIQVIIDSNLPESVRPKVYLEDSVLKIVRKAKFNPLNWATVLSKVTIKVPQSFAKGGMASNIDYNIDSTSGGIVVTGISARTIEIDGISGRVELSDCTADKLDVESISGGIHIENCTTSKLEGEVTSGSFHFEGSCEGADVSSVSGSITVETDTPLTGRNTFETVSGSIKVRIPENNGFVLDYETVSGRVKNDFTGFSGTRTGRDRYLNGGAEIKVESVSGNATIEK